MINATESVTVYKLEQCNYVKDGKKLLLDSKVTKGFPPTLLIQSHITRQLVRFNAVQPGDPLWDEDGWDGEQCIYRPTFPLPNVDHLVIHNS